MRRVTLLFSLIAVPLAFAATALATTVTRTVLVTAETEPFYACSFPLTATFTGTVTMTEIDTNRGVQLLFTPERPTTITVTNPANGETLTGMAAYGEIIKISGDSYVDHLNGIDFNFVLPGSGGVLQWIGNVNFADHTFNGRFTLGDTTAFCNYLAAA